jgi:hypothetical protein
VTRFIPPLDPDPLEVQPEPVRRHVDEPRSGGVIVWIAAAIVVGFVLAFVLLAAPRSAPYPGPSTAPVTGAEQTGAPHAGSGLSVPTGVNRLAGTARDPSNGHRSPGQWPALVSGSSAMGAETAIVGAPRSAIGSVLLGGKATWYDDGPGHYAAAGPVLRDALGGDPAFRGERVTVCSDDACVTVRLVDWCACGDRGGVPTLLDLSADAFDELAPLGRGVIPVTIELAGSVPTLPPTDAGPTTSNGG